MTRAQKLDHIADLKDLVMEMDAMAHANHDLLNREPRILRPLEEARQAAKTKLKDLEEEWARRSV